MLGWIKLTPGVDGSCGLNPASREPMPSLESQGDPSSGLLQEQVIQMQPVIIPLLLFTWIYLEQVRASDSVMSPNHSAKCLSSDTLSGPLFSVQWSHPSYCYNLSLFSCKMLDEGIRVISKHLSFFSLLFHLQVCGM